MRPKRLLRKLKGKGGGGGKGKHRAGFQEFSTSVIHEGIIRSIEESSPNGLTGKYLDVGSGKGELLIQISNRFPNLQAFACDCTDQLMKQPGQKVEVADLNHEPLPYQNNEFDLVTCSETLEHLENYWSVLREIFRVLKPGGTAIFTTPNILNLRSRFRFFSTGFYNLFGPVIPDEKDVFSPRGHIMPISWFYLANALLSIGFNDVAVTVDKYQRRSLVPFVLFSGPIRLANRMAIRREEKKFLTVTEKNEATVRAINSTDLLLGRTLIVRARKPLR
ncbi:MAG TPA: class I SAM-dependent methyltransferase [Chthoniobacterales bacterium]|nr:class I SAM-dependent methyltransferase [Chthoniobacterales bacterium]